MDRHSKRNRSKVRRGFVLLTHNTGINIGIGGNQFGNISISDIGKNPELYISRLNFLALNLSYLT